MPKKILVLVLTYTEEPYRSLMNAQRGTWDSRYDNVKTIYYHGGGENFFELHRDETWPWRERVEFSASDDYYEMHWKFKLALDIALAQEWDILFRTNSSSYVNKHKLVEFAEKLPTEKLYCGWTLTDTNDDGGECVSGAGIFLSRDCCKILSRELKEGPECEEDVLCGRILRKHGIVAMDDRSRVSYPHNPDKWRDAYHVLFKSTDRYSDATNMNIFHKQLQ